MRLLSVSLAMVFCVQSVLSTNAQENSAQPAGERTKAANSEEKSETPDAARTADKPADSPAAQTPGTSEYEIDIDYSETPELKDWVETKLRPTLEQWYPIIIADLPSNGFTPPRRFTVKLQANGRGVAATSGTHVTVSAVWIKQQMDRPKSEAVGSVVHELVHVAQQYGRARGRNRVPGWLTEGIADYIRWWKFEPAENRRPVRRVKRDGTPASYKDSYQTTAAFLEYVTKNYDHELVVKMNSAGREGTYSPELWDKYTGKPVDELWAEFVGTLKD